MEAVEKTLTYQEDTGLNRKLLHGDNKYKDKCNPVTTSESNYVDLDDLLDMKSEGTKTVKVTFTGEGNQLAVFKCNSDTSGEKSPGGHEVDNEDKIYSKGCHEEHSKGDWTDRAIADKPSVETPTAPNSNVDSQNGNATELQPEMEPCDYNPQNIGSECEELQYTDMYLNSKSESDDGVSVVVSEAEQSESAAVEDESHYITTHEIQLTELDHDVDYDFGRGTCWDLEDDNLVYSFVDYASFDSDETVEGTLIVEGRSQTKLRSSQAQSNNAHQRAGGAVVSTEQESDLCDSDKCASSDEGICKNQNGSGNPPGQIHLSIKTRAINESNNIIENENICYHTKHVGDRSHFFFASTDARAEALRDRAQYFIPAPGRQHLATKLRGKDINEYSSGASSSISELDDADKEVRNLTAKSFRSLACPYFDAINLSTSSESSMSEYGLGLNKWSAYVDLKYGNMAHGRDKNFLAHRSSSSKLEMNKHADLKNRNGKAIYNKKVPQTRMYALNKKMSSAQQASSSTKNIQLKAQPGQGEVITLTETLNFRCNVETDRGRRLKCSENAQGSRSKDEVTGTMPAKQGCEGSYQHSDTVDSMEGTHKKAIFASSLLKNVISKKMQFEQERKMERGEIRDTYPTHSPCFQCKDQDMLRERSLRKGVLRQSSETSSGFTANSLEEPDGEDSRPSSCDTTEERSSNTETEALEDAQPTTEPALDVKKDIGDSSRGPLSRSQNSAFKSWKDDEQEPPKDPVIDRGLCDTFLTQDKSGGNDLDIGAVSSKHTKLSHLFVPSSQLLPKDKEPREQQSKSTPAMNESMGEGGDRSLESGSYGNATKVPEIKIRLRSVKENKDYPPYIANLFTPKIGYSTVNPIKTSGNSKCQVLAVSDKVPHFTVRDIRDNKCRFQTPIYQVRDVRKLVKSSYPSVSLDTSEIKPQINPPVSAEIRENEGSKAEINKTPSPSPIVIKCQSVKNSNMKQVHASDMPLRKQNEADRSSPKASPENSKQETPPPLRITGRVAPVFPKQSNQDQSDVQLSVETKTSKQRQEKLTDTGDRKPESKIPKQAALEKLKAAVKTMEQLYVFDRNEWKRKTQAPRPITDSHVLSLIAREEQGVPAKGELEEEQGGASGNDRLTNSDPPSLINMAETRNTPADKGSVKIIHVPYNDDTFKTQSQQGKTFSNKSEFHLWNSNQTPDSPSPAHNEALQGGTLSQTPTMVKSISCNTSKAPLSFQIFPPKRAPMDRVRLKSSPTDNNAQKQSFKPGNPESENYLTIPVKGYVGEIKFQSQEHSLPSLVSKTLSSNPASVIIGDTKRLEPLAQPPQKSPVVVETPSPDPPPATIYHHSVPVAMQAPQPHVFCFSPSIPTLSPTPSGGDPYQPTQRKMLLDPTTGQCYLVDTPVQPATRRLFDPETGQFLEVPMPAQQPVNPMAPITPVPMSVSPLALSPGAFTPTYMIYPSFIPSPAFPAHAVSAQALSGVEEDHRGEKLPRAGPEAYVAGVASPYYSTTGGSVQAPAPPVTRGHVTTRGGAATADGKPVISITTQQGPRIIAPPSFDGTTMSFVVEHR